ncbi:superoxide dismutase [Sphingosinicella sp.]|uniref:superoxide dismutase n=1 Tax=Sphingosinicella sp. TaxID=1917971 RepID=UPI00403762A9
MAFQLIDLPFSRTTLGRFMSPETLDFHHGRHHRAYVDKVNKALGDDARGSLGDVIRGAKERGHTGLFNNAAQIWNHNFFWRCLAAPEGQRPLGKLADMIADEFGSIDQLLAKLKEEAVGHFSNGWAWLVLDRGKLAITSLHDADTPVVHDGMKPLLTLDVWEHAYYIDYRNERPKFAESVLGNIVNWEFVAQNLDGEGIGRADQEMEATELADA